MLIIRLTPVKGFVSPLHPDILARLKEPTIQNLNNDSFA